MVLELVAKTVGIKWQITKDFTARADGPDAAVMEQQFKAASVASAEIKLVA